MVTGIDRMDRSRTSRRGVWLVVGLVSFGFLLTGTLYVYMRLHRGPFRELTAALAGEFPDSSPHVEGGKHRLNEPGERILRVIMKTPNGKDEPAADKALAEDVARFLVDRGELAGYDVLEIRLYTKIPGRTISKRMIRVSVADAQSLAQNGDAPNR